jgi:UDP-N-acetylmuramate dehydrogenase
MGKGRKPGLSMSTNPDPNSADLTSTDLTSTDLTSTDLTSTDQISSGHSSSGHTGFGQIAPGDTNLNNALDVVERALAEKLGERVERSAALSAFTTFRIGGLARILLRAQNVSDLEVLADVMAQMKDQLSGAIPVAVIGQGSNLLIGDHGFQGVVIHLAGDFAEISIADVNAENLCIVHAGGAAKLPVLARKCAGAGCEGLGWMVGVPGSVGGAVRMNAGGHGSDVAANLTSVTIFDLLAPPGTRTRTLAADELGLGYRNSAVKRHEIVVSAVFAATVGDTTHLEEELSEIVRWRRANQPGGANCGSVFTNPVGLSAGKLIDDLGLRGFRIDPTATASVSDKHANFIQADPNGKSSDVWALIVYVRSAVFERYGISLHPEVQTLGFDASLPALSSSP